MLRPARTPAPDPARSDACAPTLRRGASCCSDCWPSPVCSSPRPARPRPRRLVASPARTGGPRRGGRRLRRGRRHRPEPATPTQLRPPPQRLRVPGRHQHRAASRGPAAPVRPDHRRPRRPGVSPARRQRRDQRHRVQRDDPEHPRHRRAGHRPSRLGDHRPPGRAELPDHQQRGADTGRDRAGHGLHLQHRRHPPGDPARRHPRVQCRHLLGAALVRDSYIHDLAQVPGLSHIVGVASNGGGRLAVRHNTIFNQYDQTAAVAMYQDFGGQRNNVVRRNLIAGGGYCVYGGGGSQRDLADPLHRQPVQPPLLAALWPLRRRGVLRPRRPGERLARQLLGRDPGVVRP